MKYQIDYKNVNLIHNKVNNRFDQQILKLRNKIQVKNLDFWI
jgi:hypothetical protein